jgi:hypothetical protein
MRKYTGLWIDHKKAIVVTVTDGVEEKKTIPSDVGKHVRFSRGREGGPGEDRQDSRFANILHRYYDDVILTIRHSDSVLVFGPGEAKGEIKKRLKNTNFTGRICSMETADKMTDRQISAKIRRHVLKFHASGKGVSKTDH